MYERISNPDIIAFVTDWARGYCRVEPPTSPTQRLIVATYQLGRLIEWRQSRDAGLEAVGAFTIHLLGAMALFNVTIEEHLPQRFTQIKAHGWNPSEVLNSLCATLQLTHYRTHPVGPTRSARAAALPPIAARWLELVMGSIARNDRPKAIELAWSELVECEWRH